MDDGRFQNIENQISNIKDELRNLKAEYLKKNDITYEKYLNKVDSLETELNILKATLFSIEEQTKKNTDISNQINITNTKLTTLLEGYSKTQVEIKTDIKELKNKVEDINIDTSKNTDLRLGWKQILISAIIFVFSFLFGAVLMYKGDAPKPTSNNKTGFIEKYYIKGVRI